MEDLLEKHREFISKIARKYAHKHHLLDHEELIAEAHYVLVKVFRHVNDEEDFDKIFCYSVVNHFKNILTGIYAEKRRAILISLDDALELVDPEALQEIYAREKLNHLKLLLSSGQLAVLEELIEPSPKTIALAAKEQQISGVFRIRMKHIAEALDLIPSQVNSHVAFMKTKLRQGVI